MFQLSLFLFLFLIVPKPTSFADDNLYAACQPTNCGQGPEIRFPFYLSARQPPDCGQPGFNLNCSSDGFPLLTLPENDYIIQHISYETRSFRVYLNSVSTSNFIVNNCPTIRNTTLPSTLTYGNNVTRVYVFANCSNSSMNEPACGWDRWINVKKEGDGGLELGTALGSCRRNVVLAVEGQGHNQQRLRWGGLVTVAMRGFVLNWTAPNCEDCESSGGRCWYNRTNLHFRCLSPESSVAKKGKLMKPLLAAGSAAIACVLIVLILIAGHKMMKKKKNSMSDDEIELFMKSKGNLAPRIYKYSELKKMTNSFAESLGQGGYGTVYKGMSQDGQHLFAVKVLHESKNVNKDFMNEVASISRTCHVNIVTLLGFCFEGSKRALVYEFMPNGSLDKFIGGNELLSSIIGWEKLFDIALGIARGLEYLHRGCNMRILHLDIKPQNILLDKDFNPKISDFGLAKLCENRASIVSMSGARGTIGYIAPEVFCRNFGEVSHKSDVYSYGMMIFDIVGGRKRACPDQVDDHTGEMYFPNWIYKQLEERNESEDGEVGEEWQVVKRKLMIVGLWCIQTAPRDRPGISRVVEMLEGNLELLTMPPNPSLSSTPSHTLFDFLASTSTMSTW